MATKSSKKAKIVTRDSLKELLASDNKPLVEAIIAKACVIIYQNQTSSEQSSETTVEQNGIGFAGPDAGPGSRAAKTILGGGRLKPWMIEYWLKQDTKGYPKLCKYHRQLNEAAVNKVQVRIEEV